MTRRPRGKELRGAGKEGRTDGRSGPWAGAAPRDGPATAGTRRRGWGRSGIPPEARARTIAPLEGRPPERRGEPGQGAQRGARGPGPQQLRGAGPGRRWASAAGAPGRGRRMQLRGGRAGGRKDAAGGPGRAGGARRALWAREAGWGAPRRRGAHGCQWRSGAPQAGDRGGAGSRGAWAGGGGERPPGGARVSARLPWRRRAIGRGAGAAERRSALRGTPHLPLPGHGRPSPPLGALGRARGCVLPPRTEAVPAALRPAPGGGAQAARPPCARRMLIKEYHILLPMSLDEYQVAQLYMIQVSAALPGRRGQQGSPWAAPRPAGPIPTYPHPTQSSSGVPKARCPQLRRPVVTPSPPVPSPSRWLGPDL